MEEGFTDFYKTLDKNVFKYFVRQDSYFVYGEELKYFGGSTLLRVEEHELERVIRKVLRKCKVEEYENFVCTKEGYPGNWKDFQDIMLCKESPPSICCIQLRKKNSSSSSNFSIDMAWLDTLDSTIHYCSFEDDDVLSNLSGLLSEINAFELLYSDSPLESFISSLGLLCHKVPKAPPIESLKAFLKVPETPLKEYVRPSICRIGSSTLESLNMYKVVDTFNCQTNQGYRLLLQFIKHPLRSQEEIEYRLDIVESLQRINIPLSHFPDLLRLTKRINKLTIQEILRLHQVISKIPILLDSINTDKLIQDFYIPLLKVMESLGSLQRVVEDTVDLEASKRNIYRMKLVSPELEDCYKQIQDKIKIEHSRILKICDKIKYDESTNLFKLTRIEYRQAEENLKNVLVTNFLKTGVFFTTKTLSELNCEREEVLEKIKREEKVKIEGLREFVRGKCSEIEVLNYLISLLDVFNSFSIKSLSPGYCRPSFSTRVNLKDLFHPLLENNQFIPNDFRVEESRMVVLTGPNMGGKSTYLKSIGIVSIMAQIGYYVPCAYATLPIYDGIYVRMGASDCSYKGESTFMVEMKDISKISRSSTKDSLVLIDELGRGTDEVNGLSLALAVRDFLIRKGCVTLFATHFNFKNKEGVINKKVDCEGVVLLYKIVDGVCDRSFGVNVAKKVGFPVDVIRAIEYDREYVE